jgi:hypothetical protein
LFISEYPIPTEVNCQRIYTVFIAIKYNLRHILYIINYHKRLRYFTYTTDMLWIVKPLSDPGCGAENIISVIFNDSQYDHWGWIHSLYLALPFVTILIPIIHRSKSAVNVSMTRCSSWKIIYSASDLCHLLII